MVKHGLVPTRAAFAKLVSEARQLGNLSGLNLSILRRDPLPAQLKSELKRSQHRKRDRRIARQVSINRALADANDCRSLCIQHIEPPQRALQIFDCRLRQRNWF